MSSLRFLCLGAGEGFHATQLTEAAARLGHQLHHATYESLASKIAEDGVVSISCELGSVDQFDAILTRTMPAGTLEQVTFRLAILHHLVNAGQCPVTNTPRSLEIAIDKFATLARVSTLGFPVPETIVAQSRSDAMQAFDSLGADCVVKPIFGGEGRGVMRVQEKELAWTTFSTLEQLGAILHVQRFIPPGGIDKRLLVIGETVFGIRRRGNGDFRTNVRSGGTSERFEVDSQHATMALEICRSIGLQFAAVDMIENETGESLVLEVNGIPGWKGAQSVVKENIAEQVIGLLAETTQNRKAETA
jgi:RimK family alpha-L-glutamate ligase